jgi:hypothetical protein
MTFFGLGGDDVHKTPDIRLKSKATCRLSCVCVGSTKGGKKSNAREYKELSVTLLEKNSL